MELNPMVCDTDDPGLLATGTHGADEHLGATKTAQVTCCRNESVRDSQNNRAWRLHPGFPSFRRVAQASLG